MAPTRTRKHKVSTDSDASTRPRTMITKSPVRTPIQSPRKRLNGITAGQKQALIDNLQLEVTERARKLRAQCALQAQSLRTRIELRINRIPTALRKVNMGELFEKYMEMSEIKQKTAPEQAKPVEPAPEPKQPSTKSMSSKPAARPESKGTKRTSDTFSHADQENAANTHLPNPKKRSKPNPTGPARKPTNPSTVLSPRSANSRTLPPSPQKSHLSRPASPLKPPSPAKKPLTPTKMPPPSKPAPATAFATASLASMLDDNHPPAKKPKVGRPAKATTTTTTAATRKKPPTQPKTTATTTTTATLRARRAPAGRKASEGSDISAASTGTTIVVKAAGSTRAAGRKAADTAATGGRGGGRVLRKR